MKKAFIIILLLELGFIAAFGQKYSRVRIFGDPGIGMLLQQQGIEIACQDQKAGGMVAELSEDEIMKLKQLGLKFEVVIDDLQQYYHRRNLQHQPLNQLKSAAAGTSQWPVPQHFVLGSCGGFCTIDEMLSQLDQMHTLYPDLITLKTPLSDTVTTIEGRQIYYVKISDNPGVQEQEPQVLYTGMHHAREPIGMQHLLMYMWYLLENYSIDPSVKALVDNLELYFVPVFNVDGYQFNIDNYPEGGGMWRKNRRNSGNNNYGVDINRNYGYMWGINNTGSSPDPGSETYRGYAPFSEPETRMMKYFCENHQFMIAVNYHSYADKLLYAWGYTGDPTADDAVFATFADVMTSENNYIYGPGYTTIYATNGGSDDWMYGEQSTKSKIFSYTPEVGNQNDGFWPLEERIVPLCLENMYNSIMAARLSGIYARTVDKSGLFLTNNQGFMNFSLQRLGLTPGTFTVTLEPVSPSIISVGAPKNYAGLALLQKIDDSISFALSPDIHFGDTIMMVMVTGNGYDQTRDTLLRIYGQPIVRFADKFDYNWNWNGMYWGTTTSSYYSPGRSMTDSPYGNYYSGANYSISLTDPVHLPQALLTVLEYRAKWNIEPEYDYVQVKISTDKGLTWTPLQGRYTRPGGEFQLPGSPLYDGTRSNWMHEVINLNEYMGDSIKLRFTIVSDYGAEYDGFYLDDIIISQVFDNTSAPVIYGPDAAVGKPVFDPSTATVAIDYAFDASAFPLMFSLISPDGKELLHISPESPGGTVKFNAGSLPSGLYIIIVKGKGMHPISRKCPISR